MTIMPNANFADNLVAAMRQKKSRVVVGLDPQVQELPASLAATSSGALTMGAGDEDAVLWAIREFCEQIIKATREIAVAFKPQIAFFERFGSSGIAVLERILEEHHSELFIVDVKRGDIGSTSKCYAEAYFRSEGDHSAELLCDAITANGYLGRDSLEPFFPYFAEGKGLFVLAKTSNPGSADFQDLLIDGIPLYEHVARKVGEWGEPFIGQSGYSPLGLVAGATFPEAAERIREAAPHALLLVPGIGFQGGKPQDAQAFCDSHGGGAIFNFSRSVIYAYQSEPYKSKFGEKSFGEAAQAAAVYYRQALNEVLGDPR